LLEAFLAGSRPNASEPPRDRNFGAQYRTAIFFHSPEQEAAAKKARAALEASGRFKRPIATEITPASTFWRAEEYHQKYLQKARRKPLAISERAQF